MNDTLAFLFTLLVWPGLIGAVILAWFYLWLGRKLTARLQGRQGPPFYQPMFDFFKLVGKHTLIPQGVSQVLFYGLPVAAVVAMLFALALLPLPGAPAVSFSGDLILLIYLLEMPAICTVLAGYVSRSLYGQVSASREAALLLAYNLPFLSAVIALAVQSGSFRLVDMAAQHWSPAHFGALLAFLLAVPARLRSNPFSIPNAEQEIVAGTLTEYNGLPLALFELAHGLELVALAGLFYVLFAGSLTGAWSLILYLGASLILVVAATTLAAATARLQLNRAFRFYWLWGGLAALAALLLAVIF